MALLAAITSSVALLEVPVAYAIERWKLTRARATLIVAGMALILGMPSSLGFGLLSEVTVIGMPILDAVDFFASNAFAPERFGDRALCGLALAGD